MEARLGRILRPEELRTQVPAPLRDAVEEFVKYERDVRRARGWKTIESRLGFATATWGPNRPRLLNRARRLLGPRCRPKTGGTVAPYHQQLLHDHQNVLLLGNRAGLPPRAKSYPECQALCHRRETRYVFGRGNPENPRGCQPMSRVIE